MAAKSQSKKNRQRFPEYQEIVTTLETTKRRSPYEFEFAQSLFETLVDPEVHYRENPLPAEIIRTNAAFTEWFLFDCGVFDGNTLFELMAEDNPTLAECARTQFYARFWVVEQDPERGRVVLRDLETCRDYPVRSSHIAENQRWARGTLGTRIARVRGVWREVGQIALHDNAESEPLPAHTGGRRRIQRDPAAFIINVEQVLGSHGVFLDTLEPPEVA